MEFKYAPYYDEKHDITVYRVPIGVPEFVVPNAEDAGHSVYIDEDATDETALRACEHAIAHIENKDHQKCDVQAIESERHGLPVIPEAKTKKRKKRDRAEEYRKRLAEKISRHNELMEFLGMETITMEDYVWAQHEKHRLDPDRK